MLMELNAVEDASGRVPGLIATRLETDELAAIVAAVCAKFPDDPRDVVETVVAEAFQHLKASATVTAHLIPLTLNRSIRLMRDSVGTGQDIGAVSCSL